MIEDVAQLFAARQHGVVSRKQLLAAGIPGSTINGRTGGFLLYPMFPGVYSVGRPQVDRYGFWLAGILAAGEGAVLAFRSAAALWGLLDFRPAVEALRAGSRKSRRARINLDGREMSAPLVIRRSRQLPDNHLRTVRSIPVTSPARTLLDMSASAPDFLLKRAFLEADRLGLIDDEALLDCLLHCQGRSGASTFRRFVRERIPETRITRSVLEGLFLEICRRSDLPIPEVNVRTGAGEIDCRWLDGRLLVELDGYEFHKGREKFEQDNLKSNRLRSEGWTVLRFTWRMLTTDPDQVAAQVRRVLQGIEP